MQHPEAVGVLVAEALPRQDREDLFGRQAARALDQRVRDLGPAVGEALERVLRGVLNQLLLRQREQLGVGENRRQHGREAERWPQDSFVLHRGRCPLASCVPVARQSVSAACSMALA